MLTGCRLGHKPGKRQDFSAIQQPPIVLNGVKGTEAAGRSQWQNRLLPARGLCWWHASHLNREFLRGLRDVAGTTFCSLGAEYWRSGCHFTPESFSGREPVVPSSFGRAQLVCAVGSIGTHAALLLACSLLLEMLDRVTMSGDQNMPWLEAGIAFTVAGAVIALHRIVTSGRMIGLRVSSRVARSVLVAVCAVAAGWSAQQFCNERHGEGWSGVVLQHAWHVAGGRRTGRR